MKINILEIICIIFVSGVLGFYIGLYVYHNASLDYLLEKNLAHYDSKSGELVMDSLNFRNDTIFIIRKEN